MAPMAPMATVSPDIDPRHRLEGDDLLRTPESPYHCPLFVKESRLKLSWPREDDRRRAAVGGPSSRSTGNQDSPIENAPIVHVSQRDLEMHYHLTNPGARSVRPILDVPLAWNPGTSEEGHEVLLGYFQHTAFKALATFGQDPAELGNILIRISQTSDTPLSRAVFRSILALSALHRHGVYPQAVELKISAIEALRSSSAKHSDLTTIEAIQHVAAGMLIYSFEVHQSSCNSGEWTWYLRGVKDVIRATGLDKNFQDPDVAVLLDWVYYHDVLARVSLRHWYGGLRDKALTTSRVGPDLPTGASFRAEPSQTAPPAMALIALLSEVSDTVAAATTTGNLKDHKKYLEILDWRIRTLTLPPSSGSLSVIHELYQLALLVYLHRANPRLNPSQTQSHIDRAFTLFPLLDRCDRQFPVFILGCEARRDDQRVMVLELIDRTERGVSSRSFNHCRILLQFLWAQDDLSGGETGYVETMSYVIGCCRICPTFV